jgi:MFS superfamily sulfate permease-like transporter
MAAAGFRCRADVGRDCDSGTAGTARLAGMPTETGLYAFAAGSLTFAAFGANRFMSVAADSTIAPIFAGGVASLAATGSPHYAQLVTLLAPSPSV